MEGKELIIGIHAGQRRIKHLGSKEGQQGNLGL
jgi:hypothetical protein